MGWTVGSLLGRLPNTVCRMQRAYTFSEFTLDGIGTMAEAINPHLTAWTDAGWSLEHVAESQRVISDVVSGSQWSWCTAATTGRGKATAAARQAPQGAEGIRRVPVSELEAALQGVRTARRIEKHGGVTHEQQRHLARVVDHRLLEASEAGATDRQLAEALSLSLNRTRERLQRARASVPPSPLVVLRDPRRVVPMCARPAPPPWPVSARCRADAGHEGDHTLGH